MDEEAFVMVMFAESDFEERERQINVTLANL